MEDQTTNSNEQPSNALLLILDNSCNKIRQDLETINATFRALAIENDKLNSEKRELEQRYNDLSRIFFLWLANLTNPRTNEQPLLESCQALATPSNQPTSLNSSTSGGCGSGSKNRIAKSKSGEKRAGERKALKNKSISANAENQNIITHYFPPHSKHINQSQPIPQRLLPESLLMDDRASQYKREHMNLMEPYPKVDEP